MEDLIRIDTVDAGLWFLRATQEEMLRRRWNVRSGQLQWLISMFHSFIYPTISRYSPSISLSTNETIQSNPSPQ